jgi:6-phosphogluconolactonase
MRLVLGGYGAAIGLVDLDARHESWFGPAVAVAEADRPSWVLPSANGRFVYAALESSDGQVGAWAVTDEVPWRALGTEPTGGADPCHLALSPDGGWLLTANYTSGSVSVHPVLEDGSLGERTQLVEHAGPTGPVADRQDGPHAHQVVLAPDGTVLVCDLGLDVVVAYALDATEGRLSELARSPFPAGTGPRHLVVTPDGGTAYVLGELASTLSVCRLSGSRLEVVSTVSSRADGATADNTAGEVALSADGRTVIASNRGDDTVAAFAVDRSTVKRVSVASSGGRWPRWAGFGPDEETLIVAAERSDAVVVLRRDGDRLDTVGSLSWPQPTGVAVLP